MLMSSCSNEELDNTEIGISAEVDNTENVLEELVESRYDYDKDWEKFKDAIIKKMCLRYSAFEVLIKLTQKIY